MLLKFVNKREIWSDLWFRRILAAREVSKWDRDFRQGGQGEAEQGESA